MEDKDKPLQSEFIGSEICKTESDIIMGDKDKPLQLGWYVHEYIGCEICKEFDEKGYFVPLVNEDDVKVGDHIYFAGWNCWYEAIVSKDSMGGDFTATTLSGKLLTTLYFKKDDRNCWTSFVIINREALDKLDIFLEKDKENV